MPESLICRNKFLPECIASPNCSQVADFAGIKSFAHSCVESQSAPARLGNSVSERRSQHPRQNVSSKLSNAMGPGCRFVGRGLSLPAAGRPARLGGRDCRRQAATLTSPFRLYLSRFTPSTPQGRCHSERSRPIFSFFFVPTKKLAGAVEESLFALRFSPFSVSSNPRSASCSTAETDPCTS